MNKQNQQENTLQVTGGTDRCDCSFHVVLLSGADEMFDLWLPQITEGFFKFTDAPEHRFLSIASKSGAWVAVCKKPAFFRNVPLEQSYEVPLADGQLLEIDAEDRQYSLYVEKRSKDQMVYHNYAVPANIEISIGSHPGNDICYDSPYVSRKHAVLTRSGGQWCIQDCGSTHGIYINGERQERSDLNIGDTVFIMGLRLMIGPSFFSINDRIGSIHINERILQEQMPNQSGYSRYFGQDIEETADSYFNRSPRKRTEIEPKTITVEGPPMSMNQNKIPLMLRMGSSMFMGGTAALAGNFTTLITSVLFPFLTSKYTDKQRQEYEQLRLSKYTEYLENKRKEIQEACREEQQLLDWKYPQLDRVIQIAKEKIHLWERRPVDNDFLQLRLGTGSQLLSAAIDYPPRRFALESDPLEEKMYQLVETPYYVDDAAVVLSLTQTKVCGLQGQRWQVIELIRQMILQIAVFHSYDEVKMVFLLKKEDLKRLEQIRYLPHMWDDSRSIRFIATDEAEAYKVGEYIQNQIAEDKEGEKDVKNILKNRPYYIVFALDKKLLDSHEVLKEILRSDEEHGITIITAHNELLKESQKIISLEQDKNVCTTMSADGGEDVQFQMDACQVQEMDEVLRLLANTSLKTVNQAQEMPKMVTFLEMFRAGRIEQLNPLKRWRENNPVQSLAAPVGVGADGSLFMLDLHEKRQGPHGLVAGMTGSGKSEFLITYILAMAVNYHPDEVAFVLIDYKGGGLADAFENPRTGVKLPHLAGTITNLDGASIQRSLMSIESELVRRQKVFSKVSKDFDEGSMNIYTYQKLYRAGKVSEPMPHLFIISDEFAELKQQQPEFMDKLISAARIGRSLGVHLILATQKPSGVVNDQIRSNTKFRVCLRVQDRADSQDMLKRPEAAELTDTGRFYLQVGYNEYFALGQSAWCGADYEPQDTVPVQRDDAVEFLDTTGQVVTKSKPKVKKAKSGMTQIGAVVEYLSGLAKTHEIQARQLCQPELPKVLDLEKLNEDRSNLPNAMSVKLGLLDDPENQQQFPLVVDFETCENMLIIGDSGSGKTTMIRNILFALSKQLSPNEFNFYVLDYSSRMLKLFKPLPHCGAVLQEEDIGSLDEFFKTVNSLVAERKRLFSELAVDSFDEARKIKNIPLILVVIDNISCLSASKQGESHMYRLPSYLKNSASYGIKYIVSCSHANEASSKIRQELTERICLHLRDKYEYGEVLGCKVVYQPPENAGRGVAKWEERPLEFQSAVALADGDEQTKTQHIKGLVNGLCRKYGSLAEAQRLAVMRDDVEYEEFAAQFRRGRIPLGYSKTNKKPVALPLKQLSVLSLYLGDAKGRIPILRNFLHAAEREQMELWIIKRSENSLFDIQTEEGGVFGQLSNVDYLACSEDNLRLLQQALVATATQRQEIFRQHCAQRETKDSEQAAPDYFSVWASENVHPILLLIENVEEFSNCLSPIATMSYCNLFKNLQKFNIFVIGCFEPQKPQEINKGSLFTHFAQNDMLLFGGNFDQQALYPIPNGAAIEKVPHNAALMIYHNEAHALTMPCGVMEEEKVDEDLQSIF